MLMHKKYLTSFVKNEVCFLVIGCGLWVDNLTPITYIQQPITYNQINFLWPTAIFFTVRHFVFVIVFGSCEWLFVCIAMGYADELTLTPARDALQMQT